MLKSLLVSVPFTLTAFAALGQTYDHPHMWDGGWGWGMMIFGPLMMIAVIVAIVVLAVLAVRWLGGSGGASSPFHSERSAPLDILKERFARGEIDKDEFEDKKRLLAD